MTEAIPVYQAVLPPELQDLERFLRFRNPPGNEVKYFALTSQGAVQYARLAAAIFGKGPYWLLAALFPSRFIGWRLQAVVGQGFENLAIPTDLLIELDAIEFLGPL